MRAPYDVLAIGYDVVMAHVDYAFWANYVQALIADFRPEAEALLELGCGTGSLALALQPLGDYDYYATDGSAAMVRVARYKAQQRRADVRFSVDDFASFEVEAPVDVVLLLYDGLNYLVDPAQVDALFAQVARALMPGGVFIVDQSTVANSLQNAAYFEDEGEADGFHYVRSSAYDAETRLHTTTFVLDVRGQRYTERHVQRAYEADEIRGHIARSGLKEAAAYDGFSRDPAGPASERIHWIFRRPA